MSNGSPPGFFGSAVDWTIEVRRDGVVGHQVLVTVLDLAEGLRRSAPRSILCALDKAGDYDWYGTTIVGSPNITLPDAWGFSRDDAQYEINLAYLPRELLTEPRFQLCATFSQTGAVHSAWNVRMLKVDVECAPPNPTHARLVVKIPPLALWESVLFNMMRTLRWVPEARIAQLGPGHHANIDQDGGTVTYGGAAISPIGTIAYYVVSGKQLLFGFVVGLLIGVLSGIGQTLGRFALHLIGLTAP